MVGVVERLAARGARPRRVSAKHSWPRGCGRFLAAPGVGDGEKGAAAGVVEGRAEEAAGHMGVSSAACNGGLPHAPPQPETERVVEGGEAQPPGDGAFAAPRSCAVSAATASVDNGGYGADSLLVEGKGGQGCGQLVREEKVSGGRDGRETGSRADDGELERKDGDRNKRWLISVVNLPPKRRAVSAMRRFPHGCGKPAVTSTSIGREEGLALEATPVSFASRGAFVADASPTVPISGPGGSPVFQGDVSNKEMNFKRAEVEGATKAHNWIQESQVVNNFVPDDFARGRHDGDCPQNAITKDSARHGFAEKMNGKRLSYEGKRVALVAGDGGVRSKCGGSSREGTPTTPVRGLVDVKTKGKGPESFKMNETVLDDAWVSGGGTVRNKTQDTQRGMACSNINMKQDMVARNLKRDGIRKGSFNRSAKESKCGNHVVTDQIEENDDFDLVTDRLIVQALVAPDKCPWTQGKKSTASVSQSLTPRNRSLTPRNKLKKKDATPRKELLPKVTPSTSTRHETREDKEDSSSEDDGNSMALVVHDRTNELCVTLPPCAPSRDQSIDARSKVRKLLKLFQCICRTLMQAEEQHICNVGRIDIEAGNAIKKDRGFTKLGPILGNVPGVEVGDEFRFRVELSIVGIHRPYQAGIDTCKVNGTRIAISIVASGGYPEELSSSDELIYTGSGGKAIGKKAAEAQKLKGGNLALKNCIETKTPVRVIHGFKGQSRGEAVHSKSKQISTYTYDGLYVVVDCWQEGARGSMVFKYKLQRIPGQPELTLHIVKATRKSKVREGLCLPDISQGKESIPICVINTIDDMRPMPFKYITKPSYVKEPPKGCDCTNGCSDSSRCACAVKNGGEIPFNFSSAIVNAKPLIYECGPSCRCPPTCHNRVSQHGVKVPLEIFKTEKTGWGVRSLSSISSGSFICEYVGELLRGTDAEKTENDEYLFDIGRNYYDEELWKGLQSMIPGLQSSTSEIMEDDVGSTIDAAKCGNVGRFINHSCSPNLYAQNVLWDHDDKSMPHVMLFAFENIPPLQELTYHYNYEIGQVNRNGQEKVKHCLCGSSECRRRLY